MNEDTSCSDYARFPTPDCTQTAHLNCSAPDIADTVFELGERTAKAAENTENASYMKLAAHSAQGIDPDPICSQVMFAKTTKFPTPENAEGEDPKLTSLRPCGRLETYSTARHDLGTYNNVKLTATYSLTGRQISDLRSIVFSALHHVITKHACLSAVTLNEGEEYPHIIFARLSSINLDDIVEFRKRSRQDPEDGQPDAELDALLTEQHNRGFKEHLGERPSWRLVILAADLSEPKFAASWIFHHAPIDGTSALLFHEAFLEGLKACSTVDNCGPIVQPPNAPLLPAVEDLHPMNMSWKFLLRALWQEYAPALFRRKPGDVWSGNCVFSSAQSIPKCCFHTFVLSRETTQRLVQVCRTETTSVTATLQCLFAASLFASSAVANHNKLKIMGPMSMRRFLNIPKDQMINAVTQYHYTHVRPAVESRTKTTEGAEVTGMEYFSWDEARNVKAAIEAELTKGGRDNPASLLRYVPSLHDFFTSKLGKPRGSTAELSNIGVYRASNVGSAKEIATDAAQKWEIGRMTFSQCPNLTGSAFGINVVTGGDGNMAVNLCWGEDAVTKAMMTELAEDVQRSVLILTA